jgi:hypothetical protein
MINNLATLSRHVAQQDQQAAATRRRTGFQTCAIRSGSNRGRSASARQRVWLPDV